LFIKENRDQEMSMRKLWVIIPVLIISFVVVGVLRAQYQYDNQDSRTFEGTVTAVDIGNSSLTVKGVTDLTFPITGDTKFTKDINDIKLSDIKAGDYVSVDYQRDGSQSRKPAKTMHVTVKYGKGEVW